MSETTNLKLFKHDNPSTNENQFDVNKALNQNWDKVDDFAREVNDKVIEIEDNIEELQQKTGQIEENILSIEKGQTNQNTEIKNLQQEVQELQQDIKANEITEETEQAKSLKITEASGARGSLSVEGNAEQETRDGKNLWNDTSIENKKVSELANTQVSTSNLKLTEGDYCFKLFFTDGTYMQTNISIQLKNAENTTLKTINNQSSVTLTAEEAEQIVSGVCWTNSTGLADYANKTIAGLMLVKGTTLTDGYEKYGASPSLDYPSAIKSLGSNINLYPGWEIGTINGETGNLANDPKYIRSIDFISVLPNISYAIKAQDIENINELNTAIRMYNTNKEYLGNKHLGFIQNQRISFILTNTDVRYIKIVSSNNATITDTAKVNIKLEEGETATSYSPMGQGSTKIKKTNRNHLDPFNYYTANTSKTINGITFKINEDGTITANGTATANAFFDFSYTHVIGTDKIMVLNNISGSSTGGSVRFVTYNSDFSAVQNITMDGRDVQAVNLNADIEYSIFRYAVYQNAVCNNLTLGFMVLDKTETDRTYTQHQEENYILNIQQEMLKEDYFDLERKKEIHNWGKVVLTGTENITLMDHTTKISRFTYSIANCKSVVAEDDENIFAISDKLKGITAKKILQTGNNYPNSVAVINNNRILIDLEGNNITLEDFKEILKSNNIKIYYRLETPVELNLTAEQIEVLEQLNKLRFYEGVNNILTTEDIALLQAKYPVSIQTKINNVISTQLNQIGGN